MSLDSAPTPCLSRVGFSSFFQGGFECSSHRRHDGTRLDLLAATRHDRLAERDYAQLASHRVRTVRDGMRWHLIESAPHAYDWSSVRPMLEAAHRTGTQVIWDLCHYGWPDDVDIWSGAFVDRFAAFAAAAARLVKDESEGVPFYCPVNEISFWAWAGGQVGRFNPCATERGMELKDQLVRAAIAGTRAIRSVDPRARFVTAEPLIHIDPGRAGRARRRRAARPELGGSPDCLDIVGVNFYPDNQWYASGHTIPMGHHAYRPFRDMLAEVHERYRRPILIAETGAEGSGRSAWLHYVSAEVRAALEEGVPVEGICLYPILDYPGWENERVCSVGLLSDADEAGHRRLCGVLARELARQQDLFEGTGVKAVPHHLGIAAE
jgi:hypothetical protein